MYISIRIFIHMYIHIYMCVCECVHVSMYDACVLGYRQADMQGIKWLARFMVAALLPMLVLHKFGTWDHVHSACQE